MVNPGLKVSQKTAQKQQMKTNHLRQEFSPIGIAVELLQDATDELDSFKLLFGDDIVDYIVAETKLCTQQKRSESEKETLHAMQEGRKKDSWSSERDCACIVHISLLSSLSQRTLITLEHFF